MKDIATLAREAEIEELAREACRLATGDDAACGHGDSGFYLDAMGESTKVLMAFAALVAERCAKIATGGGITSIGFAADQIRAAFPMPKE